jgi:DNA-directed RNA polymerase subunit RPC12/RpoP
METKTVRVSLKCMECGKRFKVSAKAADPECPKCGGVDYEVV